MPDPTDVWASGAAYEPYVGRWSRVVAREFLAGLGLPPGGRWLDVGCGTGALSATILQDAAPARVTAVDASAGYAAYARSRLPDPRLQVVVGDAGALPLAPATYDGVVAGLVLNFLPQPARALADWTRVVRPGGLVAAYVWDYAGEMQLMRRFWDAATALDPAAGALDEGRRFPGCQPTPLVDLWAQAGLTAPAVRPITVATTFQDFDDYWTPFLGGQGPAPGYAMALPPAKRHALRERLRQTLPRDAAGRIPLVARAWAVCGRRDPGP